jgi:hypothetical protein
VPRSATGKAPDGGGGGHATAVTLQRALAGVFGVVPPYIFF